VPGFRPRHLLPGSPSKVCLGLALPNFPIPHIFQDMGTMNVSLPDSLKSFVNEQVAKRGYATGSEYVRELIRVDQDRQRLRDLVLEGAESPPTTVADNAFFDELRDRVRQAK
jgi:antitoxin ParD1/3/4